MFLLLNLNKKMLSGLLIELSKSQPDNQTGFHESGIGTDGFMIVHTLPLLAREKGIFCRRKLRREKKIHC